MIRTFYMMTGLDHPTSCCAVVEWELDNKIYGYNVEAKTPDEVVDKAWGTNPDGFPKTKEQNEL